MPSAFRHVDLSGDAILAPNWPDVESVMCSASQAAIISRVEPWSGRSNEHLPFESKAAYGVLNPDLLPAADAASATANTAAAHPSRSGRRSRVFRSSPVGATIGCAWGTLKTIVDGGILIGASLSARTLWDAHADLRIRRSRLSGRAVCASREPIRNGQGSRRVGLANDGAHRRMAEPPTCCWMLMRPPTAFSPSRAGDSP